MSKKKNVAKIVLGSALAVGAMTMSGCAGGKCGAGKCGSAKTETKSVKVTTKQA